MREHRFGPKVAALIGATAVVATAAGLTIGSGGGGKADAREVARAGAAGTPVLRTVGTFSSPVFATASPGDRTRLFVVEQRGRIRIVKSGRTVSRPFLDISRSVSCCGEQGLLGLAFAPDYRTSRRFYVSYTNTAGDSRIVEYRRSATNADVADPATARLVLGQPQPVSNHNGGNIAFGPDRMLYIGFGDGGGAYDPFGTKGNAQDLGTLLGKILRINPARSGSKAYTVPADNPFVSTPGAKPEIWSWGLRNPWRFSFDRLTGGLSIGDVGQGSREEVNWSPAPTRGKGANFGWRPWEGTVKLPRFPNEDPAGVVFPVLQYINGPDGCSVTGGYVIRDTRFGNTAYWGRYLFGDFCTGNLWTADLREGKLAAINRGRMPFGYSMLASFAEDADGRIHLVSLGGRVARLDPS